VLLDQKRTKRIVKITAVLTSLAFAGVGIFIIAFIFLGNTPSATEQAVKDARSQVADAPNDPVAWDQLASALLEDARTGDRTFDQAKLQEAVDAGRKAVTLAPRQFARTLTLVTLYTQSGQDALAIDTLQRYTARNPDDGEAFLQLAQLADNAGRTDLARLSYQTYLRLNPQGATAQAVRDRLKALQ
jgi:cytochrome c-type biogenesis protein CcmH/NrfG